MVKISKTLVAPHRRRLGAFRSALPGAMQIHQTPPSIKPDASSAFGSALMAALAKLESERSDVSDINMQAPTSRDFST